jgi:NAD+ diphosphatase
MPNPALERTVNGGASWLASSISAAPLSAAQLKRWAFNFSSMKYCPLCRSNLVHRVVDSVERLACSSAVCKFVNWNNPVPVVAGLVLYGGHYVLARNITWPERMFSVVTGFLERGESPDRAILRETEEELGLLGRQCAFIGHFPLPEFNQLIIAFAVDASGEIKLNEELAEVITVTPDQLAKFDFGRLELTRLIVAQWLQMPNPPFQRTACGGR